MAKKKDGTYYITNDELIVEVTLFKENGKMSETLGKMLLTMATRYSSKSNFSGYTWRQDMISEAVCTCLRYLRNFNLEKSTNAFAYVTQIMKNAFKLYIIEQKKHSKIKDLCHRSFTNFSKENALEGYSDKSINYENLLDYASKEEET